MSNRERLKVVAVVGSLALVSVAAATAAASTLYIGSTVAADGGASSNDFRAVTLSAHVVDPQALTATDTDASTRSLSASATSGMLLAGLGLLGMIARRRSFLR